MEDIEITVGQTWNGGSPSGYTTCGNTGDANGMSVSVTCGDVIEGIFVDLRRDYDSYDERYISVCEVEIYGYFSPCKSCTMKILKMLSISSDN